MTALRLACLLPIAAALASPALAQQRFQASEIPSVKQAIREHYTARRGFRVQDVQLMIVAPNEMQGFVVMSTPTVREMRQYPCSVRAGLDGRGMAWECGR